MDFFMLTPVRDFYRRYEHWISVAFFVFGFVFDALILHRIDEPAVIIQQAVYLFLCAVLIGVELVGLAREVAPPPIIRKVWKYREAFLHFLLGTLLNSYTIFFFKSASALTSFIFIALLVTILILNEFKHFGKAQAQVHVAMFSVCLISYLASLVPILVGFIGHMIFALSMLAAVLVYAALHELLKRYLEARPRLLRTHFIYPFATILIAFLTLYIAQIIPPVPLSVIDMGIYHDVRKQDGDYVLSSTSQSSWMRFWQWGDRTFQARPGDSIHCFVQVYSPAHFRENLQVRWLFEEPRLGWVSQDIIPLRVTGGRKEGYRAFTRKDHYHPGKWRVQIETGDGREIGRLTFTVEADLSLDERKLSTEVR
jgi:hypothetical protein